MSSTATHTLSVRTATAASEPALHRLAVRDGARAIYPRSRLHRIVALSRLARPVRAPRQDPAR